MDKLNLEWEITPHEAKARTLRSIRVVATVLAGWALILAIEERSWLVFLVFIGILVAFFVFALVFAKFKSRKFQITETGITISKGAKQKTYDWNDFEGFITHSLIVNRNTRVARDLRTRVTVNDIITTNDQLTEISGQTFYLKKRSRTFWDKFVKTFVVVHGEPDNSRTVEQVLVAYLPHKPLDNSTEAGMVKYEFK